MNKFNFKDYYNNVAVIDEGESITFKQLEEYGEELYKHINKRTLVFSLASNCIPCVVAYTSFINHRIVPALLSAKLDRDLLCSLIDTYKPEYIWLPKSRVNEFNYSQVYSMNDYCLVHTGYDTPKLYDELAIMVTTSGSTGSPKFVRISYENIFSIAEIQKKLWKLVDTDRVITTMAANYVYTIGIINMHLNAGAAVVVTDRSVIEEEFWELFYKNKITYFGGVSFIYELLDKIDFYNMDVPNLKHLTQGGTKINGVLQNRMLENAKKRGFEFVVVYGATETTGLVAYLPFMEAEKKIGSIGVTFPEGQLYLVDERGKKIADHNVDGELVYKGPNVTLGYAECLADLEKGNERNNYYEMGDVAKKDEDNYFFITGRKKRFLKVYGHRVSLDELENMAKSIDSVSEIAFAGVDDNIYMFVNNNCNADKIIKQLAAITKLNIKAFNIRKVDKLPRNEAGKVLYSELEKQY